MNCSYNVFCDFDGTISTVDATDAVLDAFALPEWRQIEAEWKADRIGSRECMQRQVELIRCDQAELDDFLETIEIDSQFPAFARHCAEQGIPLTVLSDGIDYVIHAILRRHGLDHLDVRANHLQLLKDGRYLLECPNSSGACDKASGVCKCSIMNEASRNGNGSLLIGDGESDFCGALSADLVFAKSRLLSFCRRQGLPHVAFNHFGNVIYLLKNLDEVVPSVTTAFT